MDIKVALFDVSAGFNREDPEGIAPKTMAYSFGVTGSFNMFINSSYVRRL